MSPAAATAIYNPVSIIRSYGSKAGTATAEKQVRGRELKNELAPAV